MADMSERIGIELYVQDNGATDKLKEFERQLKNVDKQIDEVKRLITSLKAQQVSLLDEKATLRSLSKVETEIKQVEREIEKLGKLKPGDKGFDESTKKVKELKARLTELTNEKRTIQINSERLEEVRSNIRHAQQALRELTDQKRGLKMDASDAKKAKEAVDAIARAEQALQAENDKTASSFSRTYDAVQSKLRFIGSSFQTLGRTFQNLTGIGGRLLTGIFWGLGNKVVSLFSEGFSNALTRSDTMRTYEATLRAAGFDDVDTPFARVYESPYMDKTQTVLTGKEQLNEAVLGLPTSLDEIMRAQRTYATAAGDYRKSVAVAIAANNAWLANVTEPTKKNVAERQIRNILSGADLTGKQIDALRTAMPATWNNVEKYLKQQNKIQGNLAAELGKSVSYDEFIDAFIREGTQGKTADAVLESIHTYNSAITNIRTAVTRMGANIIDTISDTLKGATGKDLIDYLGDIKDFVDKISESIQNWIKKNPEKLIAIIDAIKSVDWMGLMRGLAQGLQTVGRLILKIINFFGKFGTSGAETLGKLLIMGNLFGKVLTAFGGLMRGGAPVFALIAAGVKKWVASAADSNALASKLSSLFKKFAKLKKIAKGAEEGMEAGEKAGETLKKSATTWADVGKILAVGGVIVSVGLAIKLIASAMKDLNDVDINWRKMGRNMAQMALLFGEFAGMAIALGALMTTPVIGWISTVSMIAGGAALAGIAGLIKLMVSAMNDINNVQIPSEERFNQVTEALQRMVPMFDDIVKALKDGDKTARQVKKDAKLAENYSAVVESVTAIAKNLKTLADMKIDDKMLDKAYKTVEKVGEVIEKLDTVIADMYKEHSVVSYDEMGNGRVTTKFFDTEKVQAFADYTSAISQAMSNFSSILTTMQEFTHQIRTLINDKVIGQDGQKELDFTVITKRINGFANFLYGLISNEASGEKQAPFVKIRQAAEQMGEMDFDIIYKAIQSVRKAMIQMGLFFEDSKAWYGSDKLDAKREKLTEAFKAVAEMINEIRLLIPGGKGDWANFAENAENIFNAMNSIDLAMKKIEGANTTLTGEAIAKVDENVKSLVERLSTSLELAPDLFLKSEMFKSAVAAFAESVTALVGISTDKNSLAGIPSILKDIKSAINDLTKAMSGVGKKWHDNIINGFNSSDVRWQIVSAMAMIPFSIDTSGWYNVGLSIGAQIASGIRASAGDIQTATASTTSIANMGRAVTGIAGALSNLQYRAKGGSIFRRRGTDTVPAMLTPGEFVQSRKAVRAYGTAFMQRINNLDLPGAMRALSLRKGRNIASYAGLGTTINNNNNQSVTINTKNTGSEYTYRRANRFVRGLR